MTILERLVFTFFGISRKGKPPAPGGVHMEHPHIEGFQHVDVSEFVDVSERSVNPEQLASRFDREFEQALSDHRMSREQLETPVTV
jgi:hypothetical protein